MSSLGTHLFDLPAELIDEILLRLDLKSIEEFGKVCKYLAQRVDLFKQAHQDYIAAQIVANRARIPDTDDECDDDDWTDCSADDDNLFGYHDVGHIYEDMLDNLSLGSNYNEILYDYLIHDQNNQSDSSDNELIVQ